MGNSGFEEYWKLAKLLKGSYRLAPLLMTAGFLFSIALVLAPKTLIADILFLTALATALSGSLMELYYLFLTSWAFNIVKGSSLRFTDILYILISIGLYYTLLGIALISWRVNGYSKAVNCSETSNSTIIYSILTLGAYLAISQTRLSICISSKVEELAKSTEAG